MWDFFAKTMLLIPENDKIDAEARMFAKRCNRITSFICKEKMAEITKTEIEKNKDKNFTKICFFTSIFACKIPSANT